MKTPFGDAEEARKHTGALARLSLEYKLPILIGSLLVAVTVALSVAAYIQVRNITVAAATDRIQTLSAQLRDLFQQSGDQLRAVAKATAVKPELAQFAATPDDAHRAAALKALVYTGSQPEQVIATELRDSTDAVLLSTNPSRGVDTIPARELTARPVFSDSALVGRFHLLRDTMVYAAGAPIPGAGKTYVVTWRRLVGSRRVREQIARLVGSDAQIFLGNAGGTPWTDLERPVAAPDSAAHIATIHGTQWAVGVSFPREKVLAPVNTLLRRLSAIAVLALVLGIAGGWVASRRITQPLRRLTVAAGTVAGGHYAPPPFFQRSDELGRLADAFAAMAAEVEEARSDLQTKVDERTRDLNATLAQLQEAQNTLVRKEKLAILGQLAGGVGHELRNPLGVMTNAVYYLKMVLAAQPANVHEYLEILQQQITLSEKIVSDLLDFARSKPPQRATASLVELTRAQIARLGNTNGVRINARLDADGVPVLVDHVQVGQIILNLLTNAVQAVDGSGTIDVHVGADRATAYVDVTDSGRGVLAENIEKVFEPLFTTKARGIGLGLAVSRTLARANEGDLTVKSPPGAGATFRLTLPLAQGGRGAS